MNRTWLRSGLVIAFVAPTASYAICQKTARPSSVGSASEEAKTVVVENEPRKLQATEIVPMPNEPGGAMLFPFRCDKDGSMYTRMYDVNASLQTPIKKFDKDGKLVATLTPPSAGSDALVIYDFSVRPSGEVAVLTAEESGPQHFVLLFGKDGTLKKKFKVEHSFRPLKIGAIADDKFILAGHTFPSRQDPREDHPFTAVVDDSGRVIARIGGADDESLEPMDTDPTAQSSSASTPEGRRRLLIAGGSFVVGDEGAFLLRRSSPATIYQISTSGEVVKTLHAGTKGEEPYIMQYNAGKLLVGLKMKGKNLAIYRVIDVGSGNEIASYQGNPQLGGSLACYTDEALSFLASQDGHLVLRRASLR